MFFSLTSLLWDDVVRVATTLFLIMDPLGNAPVFNALLRDYPPRQRARVIARELLIALAILLLFLFAGTTILGFLGLTQPSLNIAGGVLLFLISLRMLFPTAQGGEDERIEDPFIVPLAMPLVAGPSALAVLILLGSSQPERMGEWSLALLLAWLVVTVILVLSPYLMRLLGERGMRALARLMGMLLVLLAVQMLLNGISQYVTQQLAIGAG